MSRYLRQVVRHGRGPRQLLVAASSTTKLPPSPSSSPATPGLPLSSLNSRRYLSTTRHLTQSSPSAASAKDAAAHLLSTLGGVTTTRKQILDGNQLHRLGLTLGRRYLESPGHTDPEKDLTNLNATPDEFVSVPPGYHLAYFTPGGLESELGPDGTDTSFNAPAPFTRRMWAGGRMTWSNPQGVGQELVVGEAAEERTTLASAVAKTSRDGSEMVLVEVEKEIWTQGALVVTDRRSWIFRPELEAASSTEEIVTQTKVVRGPSTVRDVTSEGKDITAYSSEDASKYIPDPSDLPRRCHRWSPTGLFRFSALTFNGHKIHYDQSWSRAIENHAPPSVVVHGPLNLICMLDYFRDIVAPHGAAQTSPFTDGFSEYQYQRTTGIRQVEYRALSPLYAGQEYSTRAAKVEKPLGEDQQKQPGKNGHDEDGPDQEWELFVERKGTLCMKGKITTFGA
ncbi:3-methylfumaryl-CoA hydratase [Microdochium nivale]|nr:3-methylfumaryl-CoA hydratase [Microdochium nivale]